MSTKHITKSQSAEKKGDTHAQKGRHKKAMKHYKKAVSLTPENPALYDKLIESHKKIGDEWTDEDFASSLDWTMKKQELENPGIWRIHTRLSPAGREIANLVSQMLQAGTEELETELAKRIAEYGPQAVNPLLDMLLSFKEIQKKIIK